MPDSCAKALAPTMALLGCTGKPVIEDTKREVGTIWVASILVSMPNKSLRVRNAITTSSKEALPARSPKQLIVHSTWRAPLVTDANEFATAKPKSLWQCTEKIALSALGIRSNKVLIL